MKNRSISTTRVVLGLLAMICGLFLPSVMGGHTTSVNLFNTIRDAVSEGENQPIGISLGGRQEVPVEVHYRLISGSALVGADFEDISGSVLIPAGASSVTLSIPILNDQVIEPEESYFVEITQVEVVGDVPVDIVIGSSSSVEFNIAENLVNEMGCGSWVEVTGYDEHSYLLDAAWIGDRYVITGIDGLMLSSEDGEEWEEIPLDTEMSLLSIAWNGSRAVIGGHHGVMYYSDNGSEWVRTYPRHFGYWSADQYFSRIIWAGDRFIAAGNVTYNNFFYSMNGIDWHREDTESPFHTQITGIAYNGDLTLFGNERGDIAVVNPGSPIEYTMKIPNFWLKDLGAIGSQFVAIGIDGETDQSEVYLNDPSVGQDWVKVTPPGIPEKPQRLWSDGTYLWIIGSEGRMLKTLDGSEWAPVTNRSTETLFGAASNGDDRLFVGEKGSIRILSSEGDMRSVFSGSSPRFNAAFSWNQQFYAVGDEGQMITSTDGLDWSSVALGVTSSIQSGCSNETLGVIVGQDGLLMTSLDGIQWTPRSSGTGYQLTDVTWTGQFFLVAGDGGILLRSGNGIDWDVLVSEIEGDLCAVRWVGDHGVALGAQGHLLLTDDGVSWDSVSLGVDATLKAAAYYEGKILVVGEGGVTAISVDDGRTWELGGLGLELDLEEVMATETGFVTVGQRGGIWHSDDGRHWVRQGPDTTRRLYGLASNHNGTVAVGSSGSLYFRPCVNTDQLPRLTVRDVTVDEEQGFADIIVESSKIVPWRQEFELIIEAGSALLNADFVDTFLTGEILPGQSMGVVRLDIMDDFDIESVEELHIMLGRLVNATWDDRMATVSIQSNDGPGELEYALFEGEDIVVSEYQMTADVELTSSPLLHRSMVSYKTVDGSAIAGDDYIPTSGKLIFEKGQTRGSIPILINHGDHLEGKEMFTVEFFDGVGAVFPTEISVCIADHLRSLSIEDIEMVEATEDAVFTVTASQPFDDDIEIRYRTVEGSATLDRLDYQDTEGSVVLKAGELETEIRIQVFDDLFIERMETFSVVISAGDPHVFADPVATCKLLDNDHDSVGGGYRHISLFVDLDEVVWTGSQFIASGDSDWIFYSRDGVTWRSSEAGGVQGSAIGNGHLIGPHQGSRDGISWRQQLPASFYGGEDNENTLTGMKVIWDGQQFIRYNRAGYHWFTTVDVSTDGDVWEERSSIFSEVGRRFVKSNIDWTGTGVFLGGYDHFQDRFIVNHSTGGSEWNAIGRLRGDNNGPETFAWFGDRMVVRMSDTAYVNDLTAGLRVWTPIPVAPVLMSTVIPFEEGFLASGIEGVYFSTDGIDWVQRSSQTFARLAWNGKRVVGVFEDIIGYSLDGIDWEMNSLSPRLKNYSEVDANQGRVVITTDDRQLVSEDDGVSWTYAQGEDASYQNIREVGGIEVGFSTGEIYSKAPDGDWVERFDASSIPFNGRSILTDSSFNGIEYVVSGYTRYDGSFIVRSTDGLSWTVTYVPLSGIRKIASNGSSHFLTNPNSSSYLLTSSGAHSVIDAFTDVVWIGEKFVGLRSNGRMATSPDGLTWTDASQQPIDFDANVPYGKDGILVWTGSKVLAFINNFVMVSGDGDQWEFQFTELVSPQVSSPEPWVLGYWNTYQFNPEQPTDRYGRFYYLSQRREPDVRQPGPVLSAADEVVYENETQVTFLLSLEYPTEEVVGVYYETLGSTAYKNSDFESVSGWIYFAPGTTEAEVNVGIVNDHVKEANQEFLLWLGSRHASLIGSIGVELSGAPTALIIDDDIGENSFGAFHAPSSEIPTSSDLDGVTWTGQELVVVGEAGTVLTSNGLAQDWLLQDSGVDMDLSAVCWTGNQLIAVGRKGIILTSEDGMGWEVRRPWSEEHSWLRGVHWTGDLAIAVGSGGTVLISPDGIEWEQQDSGITESLYGINSLGGQIIATGDDGMMIRSEDGIQWTAQRSVGADTNDRWEAVCVHRGRWIVVGLHGKIVVSDDGLNWASIETGYYSGLRSIVSTEYQALAAGNRILMASVNGVNWAKETVESTEWRDIGWTGSHLVIVGGNGSIKVAAGATGADADWRVWLAGAGLSTPLYEEQRTPNDSVNPLGVSNLVAYAFDANPFAPSPDHFPGIRLEGSNLVEINMTTRPGLVDNVKIDLEFSLDLIEWYPFGTLSSEGWNGFGEFHTDLQNRNRVLFERDATHSFFIRTQVRWE